MPSTTNTSNLLHLVRIFADLDAEKTNCIGDTCAWLHVPRNHTILDQNDHSTDVFFVTDGQLSAQSYSASGREVAYTQLARGDTFGEFSAIDGQPRSASITTFTESVVARMTGAAFRDLISREPCVGLRLSEMLIAKNRLLTERVFEFSTLTVPQRVAAELHRMSRWAIENGLEPAVARMPTHYQIAIRISSHREAVSRTVSDLIQRGVIKIEDHQLTVLDAARLRAAAGLEED